MKTKIHVPFRISIQSASGSYLYFTCESSFSRLLLSLSLVEMDYFGLDCDDINPIPSKQNLLNYVMRLRGPLDLRMEDCIRKNGFISQFHCLLASIEILSACAGFCVLQTLGIFFVQNSLKRDLDG